MAGSHIFLGLTKFDEIATAAQLHLGIVPSSDLPAARELCTNTYGKDGVLCTSGKLAHTVIQAPIEYVCNLKDTEVVLDSVAQGFSKLAGQILVLLTRN